MLVGLFENRRIDAAEAERGPAYRCPQCRSLLTLKKGRRVIHHFAHRPPTECSWAKGETTAHLEAKRLVFAGLSQRGVRAEIESVLATLPGDRRADVMAFPINGRQVAFELQHSSLGLEELERRAFSYAGAGVAQIWIPFLPRAVWQAGEPTVDGWFVRRYVARPFERWIHGFAGGEGMWMYDPGQRKFWRARLEQHRIYVEATSWYEEGGDENYAGGYHRTSRRWKELTLVGPYEFDDLRVVVKPRRAYAVAGYNWPRAQVAHLTALEDVRESERLRSPSSARRGRATNEPLAGA